MAPETIVHAVAANRMSTHSQVPATLPQISTEQSRTACRLEILYTAHRTLANPVVVGSGWQVVHGKKFLPMKAFPAGLKPSEEASYPNSNANPNI